LLAPVSIYTDTDKKWGRCLTLNIGHPDRDSLLLVADITAEGAMSALRYTVHNLSSGGMMAQGRDPLPVGGRVSLTLRNIGAVQGRVAWAEDGRYGISFDRDIDPQAVRAPVALADYLADSMKLRARAKQ
jgi:hypothetical protein